MKKLISLSGCILISVFVVSIAYAQTPKSHTWAVIVGISNYQNVQSLKYADKDALSFYNYLYSSLEDRADSNNLKILTNEKATSYNFFEAMDRLLDLAKENDLVYIYFAGHGDIEKKTERQNGFLIGYSSPANCYAAGGCIGVRYLQDYLETLVLKNKSKVVLIVDACRSGKLAGGSEGAEITALALKAEWKGVVKILSCQPGETSLEGEQWGNGAGVFTHFLLKGLMGQADENKDDKVSVRELYSYLDNNIPKETDERQMPEIIGDKRFEIASLYKDRDLVINTSTPNNTSQNISTGFRMDLNSIQDVSVLKAYEKFRYYINSGNLIAYSEADMNKENALTVYRTLETNKNAEPIIGSVKGELLAALQNKAQQQVNEWLKSNMEKPEIITVKKELKVAMDLVDSNYYQYKTLKTRFLFWNALDSNMKDTRIDFLEECINIDPEFPVTYAGLAIYYNHMENYDEALKYINKAISLTNNWAAGYLIRSMFYFKMKNKDAFSEINKALEIKPDFPEALAIKADYLIQMGKYDEALSVYDQAIKTKPDYFIAWLAKGHMLALLNKYDEAMSCFDKAIEIKNDYYDAWDQKGLIFFSRKKFEEAEKCFDKCIELNPNSALSLSNKGAALGNMGKLVEAITFYDKALYIDPLFFRAWTNKIISYFQLKDTNEFIRCYTKAIAQFKDSVNYQEAICRLISDLGNREECIKCYDKAIENNPSYYGFWSGKGFALGKLGYIEDQLKCYLKTIELKPDYYLAYDNIGYTYLSKGNYTEAMKYSDNSLELNPKYGNGWYNRACIYSYMKNKSDMLECLTKAIELESKFKNDAKKDKDFKDYYEDPDFKKLVE